MCTHDLVNYFSRTHWFQRSRFPILSDRATRIVVGLVLISSNPLIRLRALLYTELNPVRAEMVRRAVDYPWSSARVHGGMSRCPPWLSLHPWVEAYEAAEWGEILQVGFRDHGELERLREGLRSGRPLGEDAFIDEWEARLDRPLRPQKTGRPPKAQSEAKPGGASTGGEPVELKECKVAKASAPSDDSLGDRNSESR